MKLSRDNISPRKKYKAIMLDVDGTIMTNQRYGKPSQAVIDALNKASEHLYVGLATSRPRKDLFPIIGGINLSGYSIITGGSQIINTKTKKIIWEQPIDVKDVRAVCKILEKNTKNPFWLNTGEEDIFFPPGPIPKKTLQIYIHDKYTNEIADAYIEKISHIPGIGVHKVPSWDKGCFDIIVTHALATKQHGILEVAKLLGITTDEIIGVGDGYNDFPLLMACGLKVAMGNAVDDLKAIADYIAPSVDDDGVADVIQKFVLN